VEANIRVIFQAGTATITSVQAFDAEGCLVGNPVSTVA
jgi:hypothetical protein